MSLSEVLVFYQALQYPRVLTHQQIAEELDLSSIPESQGDKQVESVGNHEITSQQKRAQKMFYKVWNGTVKHIKSVLFEQKKPVEIPGFAIFAPVLYAAQGTHGGQQQTDHSGQPLKQKGGEIDFFLGNSRDFKVKQTQVKLILHNEFLTKCGDQVQLPANSNQETNSSNVIVINLDQEQAGESQNVFHILSEKYGLRRLKQVNFSGIAKVC